MDTAVSQPTRGFSTTEFWMMAPVIVGSVYASVQGMIPQPWGLLIAAAAGSMYAAFRTWLKVAHAQGKLAEIPDLPDAPVIASANVTEAAK